MQANTMDGGQSSGPEAVILSPEVREREERAMAKVSAAMHVENQEAALTLAQEGGEEIDALIADYLKQLGEELVEASELARDDVGDYLYEQTIVGSLVMGDPERILAHFDNLKTKASIFGQQIAENGHEEGTTAEILERYAEADAVGA